MNKIGTIERLRAVANIPGYVEFTCIIFERITGDSVPYALMFSPNGTDGFSLSDDPEFSFDGTSYEQAREIEEWRQEWRRSLLCGRDDQIGGSVTAYRMTHSAGHLEFETILLDSTTPLNACVSALDMLVSRGLGPLGPIVLIEIEPLTEAEAFAYVGIPFVG